MASVAIDDRGVPPDEAASRLFEEHSAWLLAFCTRQLRDRSDAEDAVQATFLYAFRALRSGVVPECERAWLTTIAKNVCHTHRRTSDRRPESAMAPDLDRIALARPDVDEVGFMDDVRAALLSLPANQRRALLRREWQGVPSSEIADELHLSGPATDALLFRARKSFASAMSASGRPFGALNVALLLDQLRGWVKPLLGGAAVKAAVATTAASVVVGGVLVEQQRSGGDSPPATRPAPVMATVGVDPEMRATFAPSRVATPIVVTRPRAAVLAPTTARPAPTSSAAVVPASADETVTRIARPPDESAEPPAASAPPPPPAAAAPGTPPPIPVPVPPVEPPAPPPVELPPILGEDPPPIELSPPLDEIVPPIDLPPLPPLP